MDLTLKNGSLIRQKQVPSPHFNPRPNINDISLLVIHYISLPPEQFGEHFIDDFFQGKLDPNAHPYFQEIKDLRVSAHCLINQLALNLKVRTISLLPKLNMKALLH